MSAEPSAAVAAAEDEVEDLGDSVSGYAPALHFCPHVDAHVAPLAYGEELKGVEPDDNVCAQCEQREENWLCLACHSVHCGRFAQAHARKHFAATGHAIALGFGDLSFWCYECDSYLHHLSMERVFAVYRALHLLKFGEETVDVLEFAQPPGSSSTAMFTITEEEKVAEDDAPPLSLSALPQSSHDPRSAKETAGQPVEKGPP